MVTANNRLKFHLCKRLGGKKRWRGEGEYGQSIVAEDNGLYHGLGSCTLKARRLLEKRDICHKITSDPKGVKRIKRQDEHKQYPTMDRIKIWVGAMEVSYLGFSGTGNDILKQWKMEPQDHFHPFIIQFNNHQRKRGGRTAGCLSFNTQHLRSPSSQTQNE
ncbi:hypothetical protein KQX54_002712 [Cotesia glomerata]|uniref:Uncharacterized protein n=1 Tax=Cotesia glomerata TaxID=32391 RepID=A0AAV7IHC0_COTGL|nr:hypothetical protein KQX54_002712 [Cotesia glomerata]